MSNDRSIFSVERSPCTQLFGKVWGWVLDFEGQLSCSVPMRQSQLFDVFAACELFRELIAAVSQKQWSFGETDEHLLW